MGIPAALAKAWRDLLGAGQAALDHRFQAHVFRYPCVGGSFLRQQVSRCEAEWDSPCWRSSWTSATLRTQKSLAGVCPRSLVAGSAVDSLRELPHA